MTDFTNMPSALRARAGYLKARKEYYATPADGDMMYEAALYIDRLERDNSRLVEEVASTITQRDLIAAQRDLEIRCRVDNAHLLTEAGEKIAALTADRDEWKERATKYDAPGALRGPVFEQVKTQVLDAVYDVLKANGIDPTTPKPRRRYAVQTVNGYGPSRRPTTWYKIVDMAKPTNYGFERVAIAYTPEDARRVADLFNAKL